MTRAQEAEENYLIKRELATIKQQSDEAITKLEQAENTIRELQQQQQWVRSLVALHLIFLIHLCLFLLVMALPLCCPCKYFVYHTICIHEIIQNPSCKNDGLFNSMVGDFDRLD